MSAKEEASALLGTTAWAPRRLWSLWDMITLEARPLINLMLGLVNMELAVSRGPRSTFGKDVAVSLQEESGPLIEACEKLRLHIAADAARSIKDVRSTEDLKYTLKLVRDSMAMGLNRRKFFEPEPRYTEYFENPKLFGDQVFTSFPSATDDIAEAGTCLALERSTACVMHLMRVAETGLLALAKEVGVVERLNDWGSYLRAIDKDLNARRSAAGRHTPDEEFYAEASAQLDHFKRAWRNPTMHVEKSYSQQRAEEILLATKSLMTHLATRISE